MSEFDQPPVAVERDIMKASHSSLSSSSRQLRNTVKRLDQYARYASMPKELRTSAGQARDALQKQLRFRDEPYTPEQDAAYKSGEARQDKEEAMALFEKIIERGNLPPHMKSDAARCIRDLTFQLGYLHEPKPLARALGAKRAALEAALPSNWRPRRP